VTIGNDGRLRLSKGQLQKGSPDSPLLQRRIGDLNAVFLLADGSIG
jgi:hypothetical protein